jgi:predicted Fe-S protein YdhL (DUF1289 family)
MIAPPTDFRRCPACGGAIAAAVIVGIEACVCRAAAVASPCIDVCELDRATQTCRGCRRTLHEIENWTRFDDNEKRAVLRRLAGLARPAG